MKDELKVASEILGNKTKFKRTAFIFGMACLTLIIITGLAFYTGAFKWVIK